MDDPILAPRSACGYAPATDVANFKLGMTDSDPHLFLDGCGEPNDPLCNAG